MFSRYITIGKITQRSAALLRYLILYKQENHKLINIEFWCWSTLSSCDGHISQNYIIRQYKKVFCLPAPQLTDEEKINTPRKMVAILRSLVIAAQAILPLNTAKDQASQTVIKLNFTDELVRPTPPSHYVRYVTYLNIGQRTYQCDIANETSPYRFKSFDYEMFDAEVDPHHHMVGRHVMSQDLLASAGAGSIFYTTNATFTYWYIKSTITAQCCTLTECYTGSEGELKLLMIHWQVHRVLV